MSAEVDSLLAGLALGLHLFWILFVIFGGIVFLRFPRLRLLHVVAVAAALVMQLLGVDCPLTLVEQEFLRRAGRTSYEGSFLAHYLENLVYPALPYEWITVLTVLLLLITIGLLIVRPPRLAPSRRGNL